ncbi:MAG: hypothetical protein QXR19_02675 [Candidatus Jordarchaeaceae archaeon]
MERRKKAILISAIFIISIFLTITMITPTPLTPTLPTTSTLATTIGAKADPTSDDYPPWWDTSYNYRQEIIFNNTASPYPVVNTPVDVFMTFPSGHCHHGTVRVQYWNGTSRTWIPGTSDGIPYQIWNDTSVGNYYTSFTITFYIDVPAYSTATYYVYYHDSAKTAPTFTPEVSLSGGSGAWTFSGQYYNASVDVTINGGKIYLSYNNVSGSNQWSYSNQFHYDPEYWIYGKVLWVLDNTWKWSTSGNPADSYVAPVQGPLFIMFKVGTNLILSEGDWDAPSNIGYANVTYRFFKWGWITETKTTITYDFKYGQWWGFLSSCRYDEGLHIGNNWRFVRQLDEGQYKDGNYPYTHSIDPYAQIHQLGKPYWFTIYDSGTGRAAGIVDLTTPDVSSGPKGWQYMIDGTGTPEVWKREWPSLKLKSNAYVIEKYAFYVWDAAGGDLSPFTRFADGVSAIQREQYPLAWTVSAEEYIHYTVNVHVTDHDGSNLANANITVNTTTPFTKTTNSTGWATFYLEPGTYNFSAVWNGSTTYERYVNYTVATINAHRNIDLVFENITTLLCRTQYGAPDYNPIQNAYVNLYRAGTPDLVDSAHVNLTGWAEFHINRSSWFGNYDVKAYYDNNTLIDQYTNQNIDSATTLYFTVTLAPGQKYTYIVANATSVYPVWGSSVILKVYWRDSDGNNLSTSDPLVGGSFNWTLNFINGTFVTEMVNLTPQGSGSDVYYLVNVPSLLLFGGETYQIYMSAQAENSTYLPAANQTIAYVEAATFNVQITPLTGPYYWKHSDIPLWVYVTNDATGEPVSSANVYFSILGTSVSGTLEYSGSGNYTYTIPKSVVESSLAAATYGLRFNVSSVNYTAYTTVTQLVVTPAETVFLYDKLLICTYGDVLPISVIYRDKVDGTPITEGTVSYSVVNQPVYGNLFPEAGGNWTGNFNSTQLYPGYYVLRLTAYSTNYEGHTDVIPLVIQPITMEILSTDVISRRVNDELLISIQLNDTHSGEPVLNATVWYTIKTTNGTLVVPAQPLIDVQDNGTYSASLTLLPSLTPPGNYRIEISAVKENYTAASKVIPLIVQGIPTVIVSSTFFLSSLNNPAVFFFSNFGQTENGIVFPAIFLFRYADSSGSTIPNATVSAFGLPLLSLGDGYYAVVVPTYGLPPASYPILVTGSAYLYESQQSLFLLQVKERSILIPFVNIRVPLTMFLAIVFSVAIPVGAFSTYSYVKRARIPAIIRRIDQLIRAISRGEKVTVRLIPRDRVISKILAEEVAIVGVEPRVEAYVPKELADLLVPLLVESGLKENEAYVLVTELKKAAPAERERLLGSVGVSGESAARIIHIIEEEEEKAKILTKPRKEPSEEEQKTELGKEDEERI